MDGKSCLSPCGSFWRSLKRCPYTALGLGMQTALLVHWLKKLRESALHTGTLKAAEANVQRSDGHGMLLFRGYVNV